MTFSSDYLGIKSQTRTQHIFDLDYNKRLSKIYYRSGITFDVDCFQAVYIYAEFSKRFG